MVQGLGIRCWLCWPWGSEYTLVQGLRINCSLISLTFVQTVMQHLIGPPSFLLLSLSSFQSGSVGCGDGNQSRCLWRLQA